MARVIVIAAVAHAAVIVFIIVVLTARCQQATGLMNIFKLKHIMCFPYSLSFSLFQSFSPFLTPY